MNTFDFYKDEKHTIWVRHQFRIEAESYEQALEKIIAGENDNNSIVYDNQICCEHLEETLEEMTPEENKGVATIEIYSEDTNGLIYTNEIKTNLTMTNEIELQLKQMGITEVNKNSFQDYWDMLYDTLLTKYGISSSEADKELTLYYNQLN